MPAGAVGHPATFNDFYKIDATVEVILDNIA
jgi:hypothetical protein